MSAAITIRKLTPELEPDYLAFFDRDAFPDNPNWSACYCNFYLADGAQKPWEERTPQENRAEVSQRICAGRMHGYLAYLEGRPVGWCHAAPKLELRNIREDPEHATPAPELTGAIVCFIIAKPQRRTGIARRLLDAACDGFRQAGLHFAEAYPRTAAQGEAANYHGPYPMYLDAGFETIREGNGMAIVRKSLL